MEIRGNIFSWDIRKYGTCHYAVYEKNALGGADELRAITYSEEAAEKIAEKKRYVLRADQLEYVRHTKPERIQKRQGAADALTAVFKAACETGGFEQ